MEPYFHQPGMHDIEVKKGNIDHTRSLTNHSVWKSQVNFYRTKIDEKCQHFWVIFKHCVFACCEAIRIFAPFCFMFWFAKVDPINSWLFLSKLIFVGRSFGFDLVISGEPTPLVKWFRRDHLLLGDEDDYLQISQTRRNKAYNEINICLQIGNVQLW